MTPKDALHALLQAGILNPMVGSYSTVQGDLEFTVSTGEPRYRDIPNPSHLPMNADWYEPHVMATGESLAETVELAIVAWRKRQ